MLTMNVKMQDNSFTVIFKTVECCLTTLQFNTRKHYYASGILSHFVTSLKFYISTSCSNMVFFSEHSVMPSTQTYFY